MTSCLVSIIIPTYNRAHLIGETLDSIMSQNYQSWECIVVDDGSTDHTEQILERYSAMDSRIFYYKRPTHLQQGGNAARNYGFEISNGDFIQWFDDDDMMLPEFLELKVKAFTDAIDIVICSGYKVDNYLGNRMLIELNDTTALFNEYALNNVPVLTPSILFRASFLKSKNLYDVNLVRGQETELFLRLFYNLKREQYRIISEPLFLYRQHNSSKSDKGKRYPANSLEGQSFIFMRTLQMGIEMHDREIIVKYYRLLIQYFFIGLKVKDKTNCQFILNGLKVNMGAKSFRFKMELKLLGILCLSILKSPPFKVKSYYLNHPVIRTIDF